MEKRYQLVLLAKVGEISITELCKKFEVSRKTAHKWIKRFEANGRSGLSDRSRSPKKSPHKTSDCVERLITLERRKHSTWGAKKIQEVLRRKYKIQPPPAVSTVGEVLKRHGLSKRRRRRPAIYSANRGDLTVGGRANQVWATDHKGWFWLENDLRCIPLTITDLHSRYIIGIESDEHSTQAVAKKGFMKAFRKYGLPEIIRVDK